MEKGQGRMKLEGVHFSGLVQEDLSGEMIFEQKPKEMRN